MLASGSCACHFAHPRLPDPYLPGTPPPQRLVQVLSRQREGTPLGPGQCEFSLVNDNEAALTTGQWCAHFLTRIHKCLHARRPLLAAAAVLRFPWTVCITRSHSAAADAALPALPRRMLAGADGAFVGGQDDMVAVLSNSGRSLSVYETSKLGSTAAKPLYSAELKEGLVAAVYPGGRVHGWLADPVQSQ